MSMVYYMDNVITKNIHYTVEYTKENTLKRVGTDSLKTAIMYYEEKKGFHDNVKLIMEYVEYHTVIIYE